jgi:hypothetical protein
MIIGNCTKIISTVENRDLQCKHSRRRLIEASFCTRVSRTLSSAWPQNGHFIWLSDSYLKSYVPCFYNKLYHSPGKLTINCARYSKVEMLVLDHGKVHLN